MSKISPVFEQIKSVPKGRVTTYGDIAKRLYISPRQVGRLLHLNPNPEEYPCHRVVKSDGSIATGYAFGGQKVQIDKLTREGIEIRKGKIVNLNYYRIK